jgi:RIO kinase 2
VPTQLIGSISGIAARTGVARHISSLAKDNLIARVKNARYDGYRLTYGGLDYLALHAHVRGEVVFSVGNQIGVGKEADIFVVAAPPARDDMAGSVVASVADAGRGNKLVLKIHRLGRISFRTVKTNRDYLRNRSSGSWMYMSRLAAQKEYAFLRALFDAGYPVPQPVAWNRHTVLMDLIDAPPLRQISSIPDPAVLYGRLIELILDLAKLGLIHGDFNEFNILIQETPSSDSPDAPITLTPIVIDFPQSLSIDHENAEAYFDRDVGCIKRFFERRFGFSSDEPGPFFKDAIKDVGKRRVDVEVEATGFSRKMARELLKYMEEIGAGRDADNEEINTDAQIEIEDCLDNEDVLDSNDPEPFSSASIPSLDPAMAAVTLDDVRDHENSRPKTKLDDLVSIAGTSRSRRPPPNPAKVAKGWAI